jgi:hypothetical protein
VLLIGNTPFAADNFISETSCSLQFAMSSQNPQPPRSLANRIEQELEKAGTSGFSIQVVEAANGLASRFMWAKRLRSEVAFVHSSEMGETVYVHYLRCTNGLWQTCFFHR